MFRSFALFLAMSVTAVHALTVRADSWPPYNADPGSDRPGYGIEILQAIFPEVDYQTMSWNQAVTMVGDGRFDCIIGAYKEDAPGFVYPSEAIGKSWTGVFVAADSDLQGNWDDLAVGRTIGVINGYSYGDAFDAWMAANPDRLHVAMGEDALVTLLHMLQAKRIQMVVEDPTVMAFVARGVGMDTSLRLIDTLGDYSSIYVAFSPAKEGSHARAEQFDAGMAELRASGRLEEILGNYGLSDWK